MDWKPVVFLQVIRPQGNFDGARRTSPQTSREVQKTSLRTNRCVALLTSEKGKNETTGIGVGHQTNNLGRTGTDDRNRRSGVCAKSAGYHGDAGTCRSGFGHSSGGRSGGSIGRYSDGRYSDGRQER